MQQLVLASGNTGKIVEFQQLFDRYQISIVPQNLLNVPEIPEPYTSFIENALHKARHCAKITGLAALADDSGICVTALNGQPGIYSARYAGSPKSDQANLNKLLLEMRKHHNRQAYFYCCLVFIRNHTDPQPIFAEGVFHGEIAHMAQGENGHGYDPIFWVPYLKRTVAELTNAQKNQISHRGKAMHQLISKLQEFNLIGES